MSNEQTTIFDMLYPKYKITKPIRLIELFGGYGSQALALKYLGVNFEHWKLVEWAVKSIQAYKDIHFTNEYYLGEIPKIDEIINFLYQKGISSNYNEPMTLEQIKRLSGSKLFEIYNNILTTHNLVNIQQVKGKDLEIVDTDKYCYIMTYSFPCQDLSLAGKGKGMSDTSTRSGLLWEVERILTECYNIGSLPQVLLMENVPQVHGVDNLNDFNKWKDRLEELGYKNYFQDLIATDYGIPQTRNRCFMVSILGDYSYTFPKPIPLKLKLKDMLENNVAEKYYLSDSMINYILSRMPTGNNKITTGINMGNRDSFKEAGTLTTGEGGKPSSNFIIENEEYDYSKEKGKIIQKHLKETLEKRDKPIKDGSYIDTYNRKIRDDGLSSTISTRTDKGNDTYIAIEKTSGENNGVVVLKRELCNKLVQNGLVEEGDIVKHSYTQQIIDGNKKCVEKNDGNMITLTTRGDCIGICVKPKVIGGIGEKKSNGGTQWYQQDRVYDDKVAISITTELNPYYKDNLRIRKLTPYECFALMGVKREDYERCAKNQSNASLYHLAGDSIVVNVLMAIFKEMIGSDKE